MRGKFSALLIATGASIILLAGCDSQGRRSQYVQGIVNGAAPGANACAEPAEGCPCAGNQAPVACVPRADEMPGEHPEGACLEGTRYCRKGRFSGCEKVVAYPAAPSKPLNALVDPTAEHAQCASCDPTCYRVVDNFDPADGPLDAGIATGIKYHSSGAGVTLAPNASLPPPPPPDAGVPDGGLYLTMPEGLSGSDMHTSRVNPTQAEVYLLLDQSNSLALETQWLQMQFDMGTLLAAPTGCVGANQTLLTQGLAGAVRCLFPASPTATAPRLGIGVFRDLPFSPYATDTSLPLAQQEPDAMREMAYRNIRTMTTSLTFGPTSVQSRLDSLSTFESSGNPDVAGSQIPALYSIATGTGMDMGFGRPRVADASCTSGRFGYPCFTTGRKPVVVMVTDAPFHNGPNPSMFPYDYDPNKLTMTSGTSSTVVLAPGDASYWDDAYTLSGNAESQLVGFEGYNLADDPAIPPDLVGCNANSYSSDSVIQFDVATMGRVNLSTEGSDIPMTIAVFSGRPPDQEEWTPADHSNELFSSPYMLGRVDGRDIVVIGDTSEPMPEMGDDYQGAFLSTASKTCSATSVTPDAVFSFRNGSASATDIEVTVDMGDAHPVLAVFDGAALAPRWPARTSPASIAAGNDLVASAYALPDLAANPYVSITGDTSTLAWDYYVSELGSCSNPSAMAQDAVFRLDLAEAHRLRFDTDGSSFDTVISLYASPPPAGRAAGPDPHMTGPGFITCNDDSDGYLRTSAFEETLAAGTYYLVLTGYVSTDFGSYTLTVRDLDSVPPTAIGCDNGGGSGSYATVTVTAQPGKTYYALIKGELSADRGPYAIGVRDVGLAAGRRIDCAGGNNPDGSSSLSLDLAPGSYYAVATGNGYSADAPFRLTLGGAAPMTSPYMPASYDATVAALRSAHIRVGTVLSCDSSVASCSDAQGQAAVLAADTGGVVRTTNRADDVPTQVAQAIQLLEAVDTLTATLDYAPDMNPGFVNPSVTAVDEPGNLCAAGSTGSMFTACAAGSRPTFKVTMTNPALMPVPPGPGMSPPGSYHFTLHIVGVREGDTVFTEDVPIFVSPSGSAPPMTYRMGTYHQDFEASRCDMRRAAGATNRNLRPSWDNLGFGADVRPDTRVQFFACTADAVDDLRNCDSGAPSSGYKRVLTVTAGTGSGTPCTVATQAADCPYGYCSPYTGICNYLEGASCMTDMDCPGEAMGRCRIGPSNVTLGTTCEVSDNMGNPASALDIDNYRNAMRMRFDLESLGDGSRTPSVFSWQVEYRCRAVE